MITKLFLKNSAQTSQPRNYPCLALAYTEQLRIYFLTVTPILISKGNAKSVVEHYSDVTRQMDLSTALFLGTVVGSLAVYLPGKHGLLHL